MYCRAIFRCQAIVPKALAKIEQCLSRLMQPHSMNYHTDLDPKTLWLLFVFGKEVMTNAKLYLVRHKQFFRQKGEHVAVHCRRNDMKIILKKKLGQCGFDRLDAEMWDLIYKLKEDHIVHFMTDSKEYVDLAYHKFGSNICYGLHWAKLEDTWDYMGYRATSLSNAIEDFAIMSLCDTVWVCPSSSFTEWIQEQTGVNVKYYNTSQHIDWHPLSLDSAHQISQVCEDLFHRRCLAWHVMSGDPSIEIGMTHLAILRRLTERHLMTFLTFLEDHGVRPNTDWISLNVLGRWLADEEQTQADRMVPIIENRAEYVQRCNRTQGWLNNFLRIRLFDFLMSRFDVRIRFQQKRDDCAFYFEAPNYLRTWSACEHALERAKSGWQSSKRRRYE